jgi:hypothetical protein
MYRHRWLARCFTTVGGRVCVVRERSVSAGHTVLLVKTRHRLDQTDIALEDAVRENN